MISNFDFIKSKDTKLFKILNDAERLYRDGYFEQCTIQTRKFGEYICKNTLGVRRTTEETFDEILATLKDIMYNSPEDKEFIDDMYFLKKMGNLSAHGSASEIDSMTALECLKRAFEITIQYALKNKLANKRVLNLHFSVEVLMTGKKPKNMEKFQEAIENKDEILKEGVQEIADLAQGKTDKLEKNSVVIPFEPKLKEKKKKSKKKEDTIGVSAYDAPIKEKKKPKKKKKKDNDDEPEKQGQKESNFLPVLVTLILLVLFIAILFFILPNVS